LFLLGGEFETDYRRKTIVNMTQFVLESRNNVPML